MSEIQSAAMVFVLLVGGALVGGIVRPLLPEEHKRQETVQLVQLVVGMLVTFAALVLGLLTASAKNTFDTTNNDIRLYASDLIQLNHALRDYGAETDKTRALLRTYTAAAIASTWPLEPRPPGTYPLVNATEAADGHLDSRQLGQLLEQAEAEIRHLEPRDTFHAQLAGEALIAYQRVVAQRWKLVEEAHGSISYPFDRILVFWLVIIFLSFGLIAPRNALAFVTLSLGAVSIATAVFVILDLDTPFTGSIAVSSQSMRDALAYLDQ